MTESELETVNHIELVQDLMMILVSRLARRASVHDSSKLSEPEKSGFEEVSVKLKDLTYGSQEYKDALKELRPTLDLHYANNSHHPEHYPDGISGMSLLDIVEMFCDWKAATHHVSGGSLEKSIKINKDRFQLSDQLFAIFENTRKELGW